MSVCTLFLGMSARLPWAEYKQAGSCFCLYASGIMAEDDIVVPIQVM